MKVLPLVSALALATSVAAPVSADNQNMVVYSYRDWEVRVVAWDDGTMACVAQVTYPDDSFAIWADRESPIRLQFYSSGWSFDDSAADLEVQIDEQAPWSLSNANLYKQSILFDLPDSRSGTRFLSEVVYGNTLYLRDSAGRDVQNYSLAGSQASIAALTNCVDALK